MKNIRYIALPLNLLFIPFLAGMDNLPQRIKDEEKKLGRPFQTQSEFNTFIEQQKFALSNQQRLSTSTKNKHKDQDTIILNSFQKTFDIFKEEESCIKKLKSFFPHNQQKFVSEQKKYYIALRDTHLDLLKAFEKSFQKFLNPPHNNLLKMDTILQLKLMNQRVLLKIFLHEELETKNSREGNQLTFD